MTTEIMQFKCPSCGHLLGEEQYLHACQKNERQVNEQTKQKLQQELKQLEIQHAKEVQRLNEKHELEKEKEVNNKVANSVRERSVWTELKHKQDLTLKDKQIASLKLQNATLIRRKDKTSNN